MKQIKKRMIQVEWHEIARKASENARHVMGISGGKDSAALAIYIKENYPDLHEKMEYFFTDTGVELKEVYELLDKLEEYLGKPINRLNSGKDFFHWLKVQDNMLPSSQQRWCTKKMKIQPFEKFVGDDEVISYVGIRSDENREGYVSRKPNIKAIFPFVGDGIVRDDVFRMLEESVGIPEYYKWRSRSGCFFCFFQRQEEWLGLKRNHPKLFEQAVEIENSVSKRGFDWDKGKRKDVGQGYTWSQAGPLSEVVKRAEDHEKNNRNFVKEKKNKSWQEVIKQGKDDDPDDQACTMCSL